MTGRVEYVRQEPDGDLHVNVKLAARYASMVNGANDAYEHGDLVVEAICQGTITQADAEGPCQGTGWPVTVPAVGDRVRVTGSYVLDADHGWNEIHPASYIRILSGPAASAPTAAPAAPPPAPASGGCHPKAPSGNCYEPGEFCPAADAGMSGVAGDGKTITCKLVSGRYHWEA